MFYDLVRQRRSIRKFQDKEVEKEKLDILLKSALLAPSSRGIRPWEFVAVTDKGVLEKLSKAREMGGATIAGAPLAIVVLADETASDVWVEDTSIAATLILMAAQSLGLGSVWTQVRNRPHNPTVSSGEYIKGVLGIPEKYGVECVIVAGYPGEEKKPYDESALLYDKLHYNRF